MHWTNVLSAKHTPLQVMYTPWYVSCERGAVRFVISPSMWRDGQPMRLVIDRYDKTGASRRSDPETDRDFVRSYTVPGASVWVHHDPITGRCLVGLDYADSGPERLAHSVALGVLVSSYGGASTMTWDLLDAK